MTASQSVLAGQGLFRTKRPVVSSGDGVIFDTSVKSIFIGPDSDFSEYGVYYFDPADQFSVKLATITQDRPFTGRIDSLNGSTPPSLVQVTSAGVQLNRGAQFFIIPENNFDILGAFALRNGIIFPNIDLIGAFSSSTQVPQSRSDFYFDTELSLAAGVSAGRYFFPTFGRRSFTAGIESGFTDQTWTILGLRTPNSGPGGGVSITRDLLPFTTTNPAGPGPNKWTVFHYESTVAGSWDFVEIIVLNGAAFPGSDPELAGSPQSLFFSSSDRQGG